MRTFAYQVPTDVDDAVRRTTGGADVRYLAGGTNLVDLMKLGVVRPGLVVDVTRLGLDQIVEHDDHLTIGAGVRNSDIAAHPAIRRRFPALAQAVLAGASGQLRNAATAGGNLLQRTRCAYFMDPTKPCNKREPGSGCPAIDGEHRNLAVLGASDHCIATHPSDFAVPLVAADAVVVARGEAGERRVPISELYRLPGETPHVETSLRPGELITAIEVPVGDVTARSRYVKVRERASYAFAIGSVAACLVVRDGTVDDVRLAWGAVAPVPWRARRAEEVLRGRAADGESFRAAAEAELEEARPRRDNAYKLPLLRNLVVSVLEELAP
jgi:xanthine dehydrogenase YagS FAD-binding subunit